MPRKTSVVMPVYNEERTVREIVERVLAAPFAKEIIAVDNASTDGSTGILRELARQHPGAVKILTLKTNYGKGSALRAGFAEVTGDVIVVQDADLEYDPENIPKLLAAFDAGGADMVYGSRILGRSPRGHFAFYVGGALVSLVTSLLFRTHISDESTCYKVFPRTLLDKVDLTRNGFEFCSEITAKALRRGAVIREVPISYHPRGFAQGKKIHWLDGFKALWYLLRYRLAP